MLFQTIKLAIFVSSVVSLLAVTPVTQANAPAFPAIASVVFEVVE